MESKRPEISGPSSSSGDLCFENRKAATTFPAGSSGSASTGLSEVDAATRGKNSGEISVGATDKGEESKSTSLG